MIKLEYNLVNLKKAEKLAVFDLDGTLYKCNSHIEILNLKYNTTIFDSKSLNAFGLVFKKTYLKLLHSLYKKIPIDFIEKFNPGFRESAITLLNEKKKAGFHIIIVSNAPAELIKSAANRLNVDWLQAEIGSKHEVVQKNYYFTELFVCTDNISDMSLLDIANERTIFVTNKTKRRFYQRYPQAILLED
jgi:hypothetical protein